MKPKLLYVPPLGGGVKDLRDAGQHKRLLEDYCQQYLTAFEEVLILSFFDEKIEDYNDVRMPKGVRILSNQKRMHRYLYALLAPWIHRKELRGVSLIRVSQTTGALPALAFKLFLRKPLVVMTYGYDYVLNASLRGPMARRLARLHQMLGLLVANFWITTTSELVEKVRQTFGTDKNRIFLIPNGVNLSKFERRGEDSSKPLYSFISVGRLEKDKNLFFMLDCLSKAADDLNRDFTLTLVGEGSLKPQLLEHRISPRLKLELTGKVEQSRLPALLKQAQLFLITSHAEGHPKAVIEAMASGLPVVGKEAPGVTVLLKDAGQRVFSDMSDFVDAIRALEDPAARHELALKANRVAREKFDLKKNLEFETSKLRELTT